MFNRIKSPLTALALFTGVLAIGASTGATCTPAETKTAFTVAEAVCQAEVLVSSVIPVGTAAATVAQDIAQACNMADSQLPAIEQVVTQWEADQNAAGKAPTGPYVPSPKVRRAAK